MGGRPPIEIPTLFSSRRWRDTKITDLILVWDLPSSSFEHCGRYYRGRKGEFPGSDQRPASGDEFLDRG